MLSHSATVLQTPSVIKNVQCGFQRKKYDIPVLITFEGKTQFIILKRLWSFVVV